MNKDLLERYFKGEPCTPEELAEIVEFLDNTGESEAFFFGHWKTAKGEVEARERESMWVDIEKRTQYRKIRHISLKKWWVAAAVVLIILASGGMYWMIRQATPSEIAWNKIENTSKDIKYIRMTDGTEVWLNVHSSLSYGDHRQVKLEGEAFFEVAKDRQYPFTVYTRQLKTTVLGTSFNVRSWPAQSRVQVALVTGKVQVSTGITGVASTVLLPGQVLNYDSITHQYEVLEKAVRGDMTGWVKGKIVLDNTPLPEILQQLEQIYNVTIIYDTTKLAAVKLSGQFRRDKIEDVLKNVLFPLDLTYSYENGKYLVHKVTGH
ncbi:MAG: DUF4974 domain-containing protein [Chitinophagaceae bacterium]|nr:DUF4974 domain-containing protein [Chitinophagaceae bacterium]